MLIAKNHNKHRQRHGDFSHLSEERKLHPALA
jgi:hypothetical protein